MGEGSVIEIGVADLELEEHRALHSDSRIDGRDVSQTQSRGGTGLYNLLKVLEVGQHKEGRGESTSKNTYRLGLASGLIYYRDSSTRTFCRYLTRYDDSE